VRVSAIVVAHGPEPTLEDCVQALVGEGPGEVVVVDNDAAPGPIGAVRALPGVRVLEPGRNVGFAEGCNLAAAATSGDVLVFVNSDARVEPGSVKALASRALDPGIGVVSGSVRLAETPELLNTAGNPVHYLMFSWVGGLGEPASQHAEVTELASVTGVAFAIRRSVWEEVGGFDPVYFAYCEDVYLSIRVRQAGYRVVHEPAAVVLHHYDFGKNPDKYYLLERNRLMNLLVLPEGRTLRLLAVPAIAVEVGSLVVSVRDGWSRDKVAGWRWLVRHRRQLVARRREVQSARVRSDADIAPVLRGPLDPPVGLGPAVPSVVSRALARYWDWVVGRL
jgi:GT2 family glycosyltransferase